MTDFTRLVFPGQRLASQKGMCVLMRHVLRTLVQNITLYLIGFYVSIV